MSIEISENGDEHGIDIELEHYCLGLGHTWTRTAILEATDQYFSELKPSSFLTAWRIFRLFVVVWSVFV